MNKMLLLLLSNACDITWSTQWRHTQPLAPRNTSVPGNSGCGDTLIESRAAEPLGRVHPNQENTHTHSNCICFNSDSGRCGHSFDFFLTKYTHKKSSKAVNYRKQGKFKAIDWMCNPNKTTIAVWMTKLCFPVLEKYGLIMTENHWKFNHLN